MSAFVSASCSARFGTAFGTMDGYRSPGYSTVIHSIKSQQKIVNAFSHGSHAYLSGMLFVVVSSSARAGPARILACWLPFGSKSTRGCCYPWPRSGACVCVCVCVTFLLFSANKSSLLLGRVFWCFNGVDSIETDENSNVRRTSFALPCPYPNGDHFSNSRSMLSTALA